MQKVSFPLYMYCQMPVSKQGRTGATGRRGIGTIVSSTKSFISQRSVIFLPSWSDLFRSGTVPDDLEHFRSALHLSSSLPASITLLIYKGILDQAKTLWQTPAKLPPLANEAEKKCWLFQKGFKWFYMYLTLGCLAVSEVHEKIRQIKSPQRQRLQN